jgi:hypothetical protein
MVIISMRACQLFSGVRLSIRYFLLHGIGGYCNRYGDEELERLAGWCGGRTFRLFNNTNMAEDATRFLETAARPLSANRKGR